MKASNYLRTTQGGGWGFAEVPGGVGDLSDVGSGNRHRGGSGDGADRAELLNDRRRDVQPQISFSGGEPGCEVDVARVFLSSGAVAASPSQYAPSFMQRTGEVFRAHPLGTDKQKARVLAVREDAIDFRMDGSGDSITVARDQLTAVEYSVGKRGRALRGMGIGALTGVVTSATIALGYKPKPCDPSDYHCEKKRGAFAAGSVYLGTLGAMFGGVVGLFARTDRWVKLPPAEWTSRVSLSVPNARTASVQITF